MPFAFSTLAAGKVICASLLLVLAACSAKQPYIKATHTSVGADGAYSQQQTVDSRIKGFDFAEPIKEPKLLSMFPIGVGGFSLGSWIADKFATPGTLFATVPTQSNNVALIYMFRPNTRWNAQEIIAPSFFINNTRINSLRNNSYYWIELPPADYRLSIKRPLGNIYFQKGTSVDFKVEAGKTYFLRYDEQGLFLKPDPAMGLLQKGPIQQLPTQQALQEISTTRLGSPGYSFVPLADSIAPWAQPKAFIDKPKQAIVETRMIANQEPVVGVPFNLWNPLTW